MDVEKHNRVRVSTSAIYRGQAEAIRVLLHSHSMYAVNTYTYACITFIDVLCVYVSLWLD